MLVDEKNGDIWSFCELLEGSFDDGGFSLCEFGTSKKEEERREEISFDVEPQARLLPFQ